MKFLCMTGLHSMTEKNPGTDPKDIGLSEAEAGETAGSMLRAAREAAGLHVAALAVAMKVPVKKLEALEADRLDLLPDAVFVRALASSVCRNLKVDSAPILARLPHHGVPRLGDAPRSINTPFHPPGEGRVWVFPSSLKHPALVLTVLLVLAAFALWALPEWQAQTVQHTTQLTDDVVQAQSNAPADEPMVVPAADVIAGNAIVAEAASPAPAASDAVVTPLPVVASALVSDAVPPGTGNVLLVLTARGPSWVEVADAKGQILVRRNLTAGESVIPTGQLPLSVVVGRADMTDVAVRGKSLDLAGMARDNVARFEVK
jgi:cytoskeleton protein RodZ